MSVLKKTLIFMKFKLKNAWGVIVSKLKAAWRGIISFGEKARIVLKRRLRILTRRTRLLYKAVFHPRYNPLYFSISFTFFTIGIYYILVQSKIVQDIHQTLDLQENTIQSLVGWIGLPYGLIISMILARSWEKFDDIGNLLAQEASTVLSLYDSLCQPSLIVFNDTTSNKTKIVNLIRSYVKHVEDEDVDEHQDEGRRKLGDELLEDIHQKVINLKIVSGNTTLEKIVQEVKLARNNRFRLSKISLPFSLRALLFLSSLLWLLLLMLIQFKSAWLAYVLIGVLAFVVFTIITLSVSLYELVSIEHNDVSEAWKDLKKRISS